MKKIRFLIKWFISSSAMLFQMYFVRFFFSDACMDRGGRFLNRELMCEAKSGFVSFNLGPVFYLLTCAFFGGATLCLLMFVDNFLKEKSNS